MLLYGFQIVAKVLCVKIKGVKSIPGFLDSDTNANNGV